MILGRRFLQLLQIIVMQWIYMLSFYQCIWLSTMMKASIAQYSTSTRLSANSTHTSLQLRVTSTLNQLLNGYDKSMRPELRHNKPTVILTDINVRSMGPISEKDMSYSLDCYFRQTWIDARLKFNRSTISSRTLKLSTKMLDKIWRPDTYFMNGRGSYHHTITVPNKLIRLSPDGTVLYSMRLTVKATCPMFLRFFPIDEQICPLTFGSYAYTVSDVRYIWKYKVCNAKNVQLPKDMKLSQFELTSTMCRTAFVSNRRGNYSSLTVEFHLRRNMGFFVIQVYIPCTLIVILSWVAFWINREATSDRVGLGITTVLTLTTLSMDSRHDLPRVSYATALDVFIFMCFFFIIASIFEFAGVHYFTKYGSGEHHHLHESDTEEEESEEEDATVLPHVAATGSNEMTSNHRNHLTNSTTDLHKHNNSILTNGFNSTRKKKNCLLDFISCLQGNAKYRALLARSARKNGTNSVSIIDRVARLLFPLSFLLLNLAYWISYTKGNQTDYRYHHH